jgi:uncharacterized membrane protein
MVFKTLLIVIIIAILMEDGSSIKKTKEERREEKELAELVNKTLAEEAEKEEEEKKKKQLDPEKKRDETKKKKPEKEEKVKIQDKKTEDEDVKGKDKDEACPPLNFTCPTVEPCDPCPEEKTCEECPEERQCGPCPTVRPCQPCPVTNHTEEAEPTGCQCPEVSEGMTVPVAMAVGAAATILLTGVAASLGLLLRYASPIISGLLFMFIVFITWYLSSRYPEVARDLGERVVTTLREATVTLGHRVMEAIRHHQEQVGVLIKSYLFLLSELSSMFPFEKVCTKIFFVTEN